MAVSLTLILALSLILTLTLTLTLMLILILTLRLTLTLTEPLLYVRELSLDLLTFVRELTLILFEGGWKELILGLRVLTPGVGGDVGVGVL